MAQVGCAGILVKDTFCGPLQALPEPGELVALETISSRAGGCAANVAIDLRKQDVTVDLVGCLGRDAAGEALVKELRAGQVNCDQLVYTARYPTSETVILLVQGQDRRYLHAFGANSAFTVANIDRDWLAQLNVFYLGGLFAMPGIIVDELLPLLAFCREQKVVTVVDVVLPTSFQGAPEMKKLVPYIDWFLPNNTETALLTGEINPLKALYLFRHWGANGVIITLGEKGAIGVQGEECWRCNAYPWQTVDPSGAGDAFASGLIVGILNGWDFGRSLTYASALGASATRAVGTTDGVLTKLEADRVVAAQPLRVSHEALASPL
jgi:sugar/nucleoside kinase (ribokinase family)